MIISAASGKDGTGKTILSASFAIIAQKKAMADCDVDTANLYLLLLETWCKNNRIPLLGKIPYDDDVTKSMAQGIPLTEYTNNSTSKEIKNIWQKPQNLLAIEEIKK